MDESKRVADAIYEQAFLRYVNGCIENLNQLPSDRANKAWAVVARFYRQATEDDRKAVDDFVRSIVADTASIILGGLDGVTDLDTLDGDISVTYDGQVVSGDLQEYFLAAVEKFTQAER